MDNVLSRIFGPIILIIMMLVVPIIWIATGLDNTQRSAVDKIVHDYAAEVKSTGVITKENYDSFLRDLQKTGETYDITVVHKSLIAVPEAGGTYSKAYRSYGKEDILNYIEGFGADQEPGTADDTDVQVYKMKQGDFINITVVSTNGSIGTRYLDAANGSPIKGIKIKATAGGMIGNTR